MKLTEHEHCFLIKDFFISGVIAGFTKDNLDGNLPQDIYKALSFANQEFKLASLKQIHSSIINLVEDEGLFEGDALFTKADKLVLVVKTADCLPLFFESQKQGVIGVVHMGWRPAQEGILDKINYDLSSFKVVAGVGLRKCCYQVGDEFLEFPNFKPFLDKKEGGFYFDSIRFVKESLMKKDLQEENFSDLNICSLSCPDFFSYRRNKTSKRTLSFIVK